MEDGNDDIDTEDAPLPPKLRNFREAMHSLEDVQNFMDNWGCLQEATAITFFPISDLSTHIYLGALCLSKYADSRSYILAMDLPTILSDINIPLCCHFIMFAASV